MRLRHGTHWRSIGDTLAERLTRAGVRLRKRMAFLIGAVVAGGIAVLLAGLSQWVAVGGCFLAFVAFVACFDLEDEDRPPRRGTSQVGAAANAAPMSGWQLVLDAIPDPVLALGNGGRIAHLNPAARDIYATLRVGGQVALLSRDPEFLQAIDDVMDDGRQRTIEVQERVPIDRRIRITLTAMPEEDPAGLDLDAPRVVIVLRDLTEQDRLARMRADFVANASHELRTPLASVVGFIETLQGRAGDDPAARTRFLGIMSEQAARMSRLVGDLLSLSRVEMREHVPPRTAIDLNETVANAVQALEPVAQHAGATLSLSLANGPAMVLGDTDEIVQVAQNLVQNGIKYGRPGGTVEVTVRRVRQGPMMRLVIAVRDEGPGIAPEHLPRLTERFYRVNAKSSREKGGTGLGLAIVKHIANRHRGELRITSELGKGSTFAFVIDEQMPRPGHSHAH